METDRERMIQESRAYWLAWAGAAWFDYDRQAWVQGGVYQDCGHPEAMACGCYGRTHQGERAL